MICQNCHTEVDDDLIFCTNCGERLFESTEEEQTVLMNEPAVTKRDDSKPTVLMNDSVVTNNKKLPKSSSNLKWAALIIALIAIPASIFGLLLLKSRNQQVSQNTTKPSTPAPTPTRKANTNQNSNANTANINANSTKANTNIANKNKGENPKAKEIMSERIEIAPSEHYAVKFEVNDDTARISGKVTVLQGDKINGFVYLQKMYEEHFPDETYKMFSFGGSKTAEVNQTLVEEDYVLVFVNNGEKSVVIQGGFSIISE